MLKNLWSKKMSDLISINIENLESLSKSFSHNLRMKPPSYLIDESDKNIDVAYIEQLTTFKKKEDFDEFQDNLTNKIKDDYLKHNKQKMQEKTIIFKEAVISFGREQFKNCDVKDINKALTNFVENFENKYKVKVLSHSIHLDEGHLNEKGEKEHNYHAHFQIANYDFDLHKTGMRKVNYSKLQTELADAFKHLGFQRGREYIKEQKAENLKAEKEGVEPLKIERPTHMPHFQYRQLKTAKNTVEKDKLNKELREKQDELKKLMDISKANIEFAKNQQLKIEKLDKEIAKKEAEFDKYDNLLADTIADLTDIEKTKKQQQEDLDNKKLELEKFNLELNNANNKLKEVDLKVKDAFKKMDAQRMSRYSSILKQSKDNEMER